MPTNPTSLQPLPLEGASRLREMSQEPRAGAMSRLAPGSSFQETLEDSIKRVNDLQLQADQAIQDLTTGESKDVAQTMIAVQKASLSFQLMTQVRNKIVQAYEEVMRMPI